jgi:hypothetical protein
MKKRVLIIIYFSVGILIASTFFIWALVWLFTGYNAFCEIAVKILDMTEDD